MDIRLTRMTRFTTMDAAIRLVIMFLCFPDGWET